jgi:hypothetical protein
MTLKGAPHALSIAEAALLSDGLDRCDGLLEFDSGRIDPRPFGELRRRLSDLSDLAAKEPGEIARAHAHAICQGLYAEILPRMTEYPGYQLLYIWPLRHVPKCHIGAELGLAAGTAGKNHNGAGDGQGNFLADILFDQSQGEIDPCGDPARGIDILEGYATARAPEYIQCVVTRR